MTIVPLKIANSLKGARASDAEISGLKERFANGLLPEWLIAVLQSYKLSGASLSLSEDKDLSGLGAE